MSGRSDSVSEMRRFLSTIALAITAWSVSALPTPSRGLFDAYDYIVVGGGPGE